MEEVTRETIEEETITVTETTEDIPNTEYAFKEETKTTVVTNPNGANGTTSDPREQTCWDNYVKSLLAGQTNAYQSALDAGYTESSAKTITTRDWFIERLQKLKRKDMLSKAEKVLDRTLSYEPIDKEGKLDVPLVRVQTDVAKHVTSTLGKNEGYSTKTETDTTIKGSISLIDLFNKSNE